MPRGAASARQVSIPPAGHIVLLTPPPLGGRRSCSHLSLRGLNKLVELHAHSMHIIRYLGSVCCCCNVAQLRCCIRLLQALLPHVQLRCAQAQRLLGRGLLLLAAAAAACRRLLGGGGPLNE